MRVKTSITLPSELLGRLDRIDKNRSALLERAARAYLARLEGDERDRRDIEIIDRNADRLTAKRQTRLDTAAAVKRGEFYLVRKPGSRDPPKQRVLLVVSRYALIESRFTSVVCAPVYSQHDGLSVGQPFQSRAYQLRRVAETG